MANKLFQRVARVSFGTPIKGTKPQQFSLQVIQDLRIQFKVKRTLKHEPSTCDVSVSNLNENSRALVQQKHVRVFLEAGYTDSVARIFSGDSRYVDQLREGPDWVTKIQCGDGERNYQYRRVAASFARGTHVRDVITTVAQSLGLTIVDPNNVVAGLTEQFTQGYTVHGLASTELQRLFSGRGIEWSIQHGQIQILQDGGFLPEDPNRLILVSTDTGMIGSPEHGNPEKDVPLDPDQYTATATKKRGPAILKVKSLLQPGFAPGKRIQLRSVGINGLFRIQTVTHTGDTHGGDWFSELECIPST